MLRGARRALRRISFDAILGTDILAACTVYRDVRRTRTVARRLRPGTQATYSYTGSEI